MSINALCMYAISYSLMHYVCMLLVIAVWSHMLVVSIRHCACCLSCRYRCVIAYHLCYGRRVGRCSRLSVTGVHGSSAGSRRVASLLIVSCVVTSCVDSRVHCCRVCQVDTMAGDRRLACSWCIHDLLGILIRMSCLAASMS
jgi:hypothetical protein